MRQKFFSSLKVAVIGIFLSPSSLLKLLSIILVSSIYKLSISSYRQGEQV